MLIHNSLLTERMKLMNSLELKPLLNSPKWWTWIKSYGMMLSKTELFLKMNWNKPRTTLLGTKTDKTTSREKLMFFLTTNAIPTNFSSDPWKWMLKLWKLLSFWSKIYLDTLQEVNQLNYPKSTKNKSKVLPKNSRCIVTS